MWVIIAAWPASVWVVIVPLAAKALWKPIAMIVSILSGRHAVAENLIDVLRKALDKNLIRESALAGALETLIFAIDHLEDPPFAIVDLRRRALEQLEHAQQQLKSAK